MTTIHEKYFFMIQDIRAAKIAGNLALLSGFKESAYIPELGRNGLPVQEETLDNAAIVARVIYDEAADEYQITPFGCLVEKATRSYDVFMDTSSTKLNATGHAAFDAVTSAIETSLVEFSLNSEEKGVNIIVPDSPYQIFIPAISPEEYFSI